MAKVFISHVTTEVQLVEAFCAKVRSLGHEPVLVEEMPSLGMPPNEKVSHYLRQCEAAVVLATRDPEGGEKTRQNIVEEIGRIQQHWSRQHPPWVLFREVGVRLPSNVGTGTIGGHLTQFQIRHGRWRSAIPRTTQDVPRTRSSWRWRMRTCWRRARISRCLSPGVRRPMSAARGERSTSTVCQSMRRGSWLSDARSRARNP